jgi:hypothetical protein
LWLVGWVGNVLQWISLAILESELLMTRWKVVRATMFVALLVVVPVVSLGAAAPALAAPTGIFSIFKECPLSAFTAKGVSPEVALCTYNQTTSGEFAIGSTGVPINQTITLQGGVVPTGNPENPKEYYVLPAANPAESISKTELNVPGGLADLVDCEEIKGSGILEILERGACKAIFESKLTGVTATTEIVASTSNPAILNLRALARETGTALTLPIRVHLKNPLLGSGCYIGSEASPIQLHLTTGATSPDAPNTSIHGATGEPETLEEESITMLRVINNSLVDNAFSVPVAEGCGGLAAFLIDPIVDSKLKLPSEDGNNTAILDGTLNTATQEAVEANEKL